MEVDVKLPVITWVGEGIGLATQCFILLMTETEFQDYRKKTNCLWKMHWRYCEQILSGAAIKVFYNDGRYQEPSNF